LLLDSIGFLEVVGSFNDMVVGAQVPGCVDHKSGPRTDWLASKGQGVSFSFLVNDAAAIGFVSSV
jgi:hypothetical protein